MVSHNHKIPWPVETLSSDLSEAMRQLAGFGLPTKQVFRGTPEQWPNLQPGLLRISHSRQRIYGMETTATEFVGTRALEERIIERFEEQIKKQIDPDPIRRMSLESRVGILQYMQHYTVPTRLLDWSESIWIALYFACAGARQHHGLIWWFNYEVFEERVHQRWEQLGVVRTVDQTVDLEGLVRAMPPIPWITGLWNKVPFRRMQLQQGLFTVCGDTDRDHSIEIGDLLPASSYGCLLVPRTMKLELLRTLVYMNVYGTALGLSPDDEVGKSVMGSLKGFRNDGY